MSLKEKILQKIYPKIDDVFRAIDRKHIRRTRNIKRIPEIKYRLGGKVSYAEWAHVIGIFQTLICQNLHEKKENNILDIGCGTGLVPIASEPFVSDGGKLTGLDVNARYIKYCQDSFKDSHYEFIHFNTQNEYYAVKQDKQKKKWPIEDNSQDMVTALSVWTHLNEVDAQYYMKEVYRVLKNGSRAIITFFSLDDKYKESLNSRKDELGKYHPTNQMQWIFDESAYESRDWFSPKWVKTPEAAIGIREDGINRLLSSSKLKLVNKYNGNWKEEPGIFFQDIFVLEK